MPEIEYVWDELSDNVIEEYEDGVLSASYDHEPGLYGILLSQNRSGVTSYYHYDGRGDTVALTDDAGNVTDTKEYDAWGNVIASTGSTVTQFQFAGRSGANYDAVAKMLQLRQMTYATTIARDLAISTQPLSGFAALIGYSSFQLQLIQATGTVVSPFNIVVEKGSELFPFPRCGGQAGAGWKFTIQGGAPCNGYLIQRVRFSGHLYRDCNLIRKPEIHHFQYVEAWQVFFQSPNVSPTRLNRRINSLITDNFFGVIPDFTAGAFRAIGTLWLVCVAPQPPKVIAEAHRNPRFQVIDYDEVAGWISGTVYGEDPWIFSAGELKSSEISRDLPDWAPIVIGGRPLQRWDGPDHKLQVNFNCCTKWTECSDGHYTVWRENNYVTAEWEP